MRLFSFATLAPLALLTLAALFGGPWGWLALIYMTALTAGLDEAVARITPPGSEAEFPAANRLSVALALGHLMVLPLVVWSLALGDFGVGQKLALFAAAGLFMGQVSNANAHELIHRGSRGLHRLGMWVYISLLFGHHTSAHPLVHHVHVGTAQDPSTSRLGEGYYRFAARAWRGSFRAGLRIESARLTRAGLPRHRHPYVIYLVGAAVFIALAVVLAGVPGLLWYLALAWFAQSQLLLSDYVQHYGLVRAPKADGKPGPVTDKHSWNAPHWYSSALMLNAPRHSDHHARPARPYVALELPNDAPTLPRSLPVMACVALIPPLWRRVMDPKATHWRERS